MIKRVLRYFDKLGDYSNFIELEEAGINEYEVLIRNENKFIRSFQDLYQSHPHKAEEFINTKLPKTIQKKIDILSKIHDSFVKDPYAHIITKLPKHPKIKNLMTTNNEIVAIVSVTSTELQKQYTDLIQLLNNLKQEINDHTIFELLARDSLQQYHAKERWYLSTINKFLDSQSKIIEQIINRTSLISMTRRAFLAKAFKYSAAAFVASVGLKSSLKSYIHHFLPNPRTNKLAVLMSEPNAYWEKIAASFVEWYLIRVQLAFGKKANTFFNATQEDLLKIARDPSYSDIVIAGHGSWDAWIASDKTIEESELKLHNFPKKKGLFIRHTCGLPDVYYTPKKDVLNTILKEIQLKIPEITRVALVIVNMTIPRLYSYPSKVYNFELHDYKNFLRKKGMEVYSIVSEFDFDASGYYPAKPIFKYAAEKLNTFITLPDSLKQDEEMEIKKILKNSLYHEGSFTSPIRIKFAYYRKDGTAYSNKNSVFFREFENKFKIKIIKNTLYTASTKPDPRHQFGASLMDNINNVRGWARITHPGDFMWDPIPPPRYK